eukprot:TRINITY_DN8144_c0_g1_i5.p1 TRINITY_DN8144_c0_g1~~TRINITY_DN8144_c0_g1_i5.p1  ORF type:complete len:170 (-),score=13.01 TRINITY_DN8144_c0_g1_i5:32-541(-)
MERPEGDNLAKTLCETFCAVIFGLGLGLSELIIAGLNWEAVCDQPLQLWLLILGVAAFATVGLQIIRLVAVLYFQNNKENTAFQKVNLGIFATSMIFFLFFVIWNVIGSFWYWGHDNNQDTCPTALKTMSLVMLILFYVSMGLTMIGIVTGLLAYFFLVYRRQVSQPIN